jgi:predicted transcriptional regulator
MREGAYMGECNFISNYGLVLIYISKHPRSTAREIASAVNVTEWTVHKIISELERDGFVNRKRVGRRNSYHVNRNNTLRHHIIDHVSVRDFLSLLA